MKIDHVGIVVDSIENSLEYYKNNFKLEPISRVFIDPIQKVKIVFISPISQNIKLELLEPLSDDSPIMPALEKGGGLNHICYEVNNIMGAIKSLREKGNKLISGPTTAVAFSNRKIAFLYTRSQEIVELLESES